jgi:shikimate kinase
MSATRPIVLVGLPGSGKSVVGRLVAETLGARFVDVDAMIEQEEGAPISQIFADKGEAEFRVLERAAVSRLLVEEPCVVAPGGGWAVQEGNLTAATAGALTVYLQVSPGAATARIAGTTHRPLLGGEVRESSLGELLKEREPWYSRCEAAVQTDGRTAEVVASEVVTLARNQGGW